MRRITTTATTLFGCNWALAAFAHPNHGVPHVHVLDRGLSAGLVHPILGFDHLLAMVAIGLFAAQFAGRLKWIIPGCFLVGMVAGGVLGIAGMSFGYAEAGIAVSLISLGCALAVGKQVRLLLVLAAAALFGLMHGFAHGMEVSTISSPAWYVVGFLLTTIGLHVLGVAVGSWAWQSSAGKTSLRLSGAAVAIVGMCLLAAL